MCYQFTTNFSCGHKTSLDDQCGEAAHNNLEPSQCTNLKTQEVNHDYICPDCDKRLSQEDLEKALAASRAEYQQELVRTEEGFNQILQESRPKWHEECLGEEGLQRLSGLQIGEVDEAQEQAEMAKAMQESITSQFGGRFSLKDFAPDPPWIKRQGIADFDKLYADEQAAESSAMGAARNRQPSSRAFVPITPIQIPSQDKALPPQPGPPPNRPLPPTPTTPTNPTPPRNPEKQRVHENASPRSPPASPPGRYSLFPPPTSPGRPSDAPNLIHGVPVSPTRQHPAARTAGRPPTGGRVPPPVEGRGQNH